MYETTVNATLEEKLTSSIVRLSIELVQYCFLVFIFAVHELLLLLLLFKEIVHYTVTIGTITRVFSYTCIKFCVALFHSPSCEELQAKSNFTNYK